MSVRASDPRAQRRLLSWRWSVFRAGQKMVCDGWRDTTSRQSASLLPWERPKRQSGRYLNVKYISTLKNLGSAKPCQCRKSPIPKHRVALGRKTQSASLHSQALSSMKNFPTSPTRFGGIRSGEPSCDDVMVGERAAWAIKGSLLFTIKCALVGSRLAAQ